MREIEEALSYAQRSLNHAQSETTAAPIRRYMRMLTKRFRLIDAGLAA